MWFPELLAIQSKRHRVEKSHRLRAAVRKLKAEEDEARRVVEELKLLGLVSKDAGNEFGADGVGIDDFSNGSVHRLRQANKKHHRPKNPKQEQAHIVVGMLTPKHKKHNYQDMAAASAAATHAEVLERLLEGDETGEGLSRDGELSRDFSDAFQSKFPNPRSVYSGLESATNLDGKFPDFNM